MPSLERRSDRSSDADGKDRREAPARREAGFFVPERTMAMIAKTEIDNIYRSSYQVDTCYHTAAYFISVAPLRKRESSLRSD